MYIYPKRCLDNLRIIIFYNQRHYRRLSYKYIIIHISINIYMYDYYKHLKWSMTSQLRTTHQHTRCHNTLCDKWVTRHEYGDKQDGSLDKSYLKQTRPRTIVLVLGTGKEPPRKRPLGQESAWKRPYEYEPARKRPWGQELSWNDDIYHNHVKYITIMDNRTV